jgi:hypothetical protein
MPCDGRALEVQEYTRLARMLKPATGYPSANVFRLPDYSGLAIQCDPPGQAEDIIAHRITVAGWSKFIQTDSATTELPLVVVIKCK